MLWCVPVIVIMACSPSDSDARTARTFAMWLSNPHAQRQARETSTMIVESLGITKNKNEFIKAIIQAHLVGEMHRLQYDINDLYTFAKSLPEGFRASEDLEYALSVFRQSLPQAHERLPTKNAFLYKSWDSILSFNTDSQYAQSAPGRDTWIKLRNDCKIATHLSIRYIMRADSLEHYIDESTQHSRHLPILLDGYTVDSGSVPNSIDEEFVGIVISKEESEIYIHKNNFAIGNVLEILYQCDS